MSIYIIKQCHSLGGRRTNGFFFALRFSLSFFRDPIKLFKHFGRLDVYLSRWIFSLKTK